MTDETLKKIKRYDILSTLFFFAGFALAIAFSGTVWGVAGILGSASIVFLLFSFAYHAEVDGLKKGDHS